MTRLEAADLIASKVEAAGYSASSWAPEGSEGPVRVYVTIPAASWKKKARKIGYIGIERDGSLVSGLEVQSGTIMGLVGDIQIDPVAPKSSVSKAAASGYVDEDIAAFEGSARATAAAELGREQG